MSYELKVDRQFDKRDAELNRVAGLFLPPVLTAHGSFFIQTKTEMRAFIEALEATWRAIDH